jgi:hypothetical protein
MADKTDMNAVIRGRRRPNLVVVDGTSRNSVNRFIRGQIDRFEPDDDFDKLLELKESDVSRYYALPSDVRARVAAYAEAKAANDDGSDVA